ncbi:PadR family transcriptional regulator [Desulfomonile tiedjei]|uniref:Putative transcriptional regulator n=1 Tax=Desulfomonile tiedjei (strain ATCC 49306 / DSM 6799 / DCB-1) TaxID=706587 RepID=I4C6A5_DESTA|nr:PadR family transcriptional regulator [Desulfomonile tiedjei]AFM25096.1 putative transcriptional regulator [Desulfomonile tiedjei DSM 6799]
MDIQSILLGFLMRNSMTGYDLKKAFSISFAFFSGLSYGSIYPALRKMEKNGLITKQVEIQDGAPNRKVYTITETGRTEFLNSLKSPLSPEQPKSTFLMRLFFFGHLSPQDRKSVAQKHLGAIKQMQAQLQSVQPQVAAHADRFQYLCYEFGLRSLSDLARNLSQVIDALEEEPNVQNQFEKIQT